MEFLKAGGKVSGFSENRWKTVQKVKPGDYLICYLTGVSRFIGVLEVISKPFKDTTKIWRDNLYPSRLKVQTVVALEFDNSIPVKKLKDKLSFFQNLKNPNAWTGRFRGSPSKWSKEDGLAVLNALLGAKKNPEKIPIDQKALLYRPKAIRGKKRSYTLPQKKEKLDDKGETKAVIRDHLKMQHLLYEIARNMGLDVWVAKNDHGRKIGKKKFGEFPGIRKKLTLHLDPATLGTIELIDILWLEKNAVLAAFEIEHTTSIYSGLLRMSDLIAIQPNINIPLYIVAPDNRRDKVIDEIGRPTFSSLNTPLAEICRFISFERLKDMFERHSEVIQAFKPLEFLDIVSETCELEDT
ncbi:MAG: EVE domain-containing protein [Candidatus Zixiibacteriota bacterium]|nr:MAG: EVE domain-containing protein [candidate division Zixibacteria bacterium]